MTTRLPLVAAQPGIWMAERLSTLPGAWSVAHYVELRGALDPTLLGKAIVAGLQQADTLSLRFEEEEGEVWQWLAADRTFAEPSIIDLRTAPDPHRAATERMQADLAQDLRVDGGNPLVCHQLLRVGDDRWYWYQRYHHLLVDGFQLPGDNPADRRHLPRLAAGEATPESPFTPSPRWWTSTSATPAARPGSGIKLSGRPSARRYRRLPHSLPRRWAGAPPGAISGG